ncbi:hypothetical protein GCM10020000_67290 [Streptomyces olivoverticillatus]
MERLPGAGAAAQQPPLPQPLLRPVQRRVGSGEHGLGGPVDRADDHSIAQRALQRADGRGHRQHPPGGVSRTACVRAASSRTASGSDTTPRQHGRHGLPDAVPEQRRRAHSPVQQQPPQGVAQCEQQRLGPPGVVQAVLPPVQPLGPQRGTPGPQQAEDGVHRVGEHRLRAVQMRAHARMLGALACEEQRHGTGPTPWRTPWNTS